jgi:putative zinc finger/helix-turn-helix YgiT family protein
MFTCTHCGDINEDQTKVISLEETFAVKGEPTTIQSTVRVCGSCNEPVYDKELDSANLLRAYDVYRQKHCLMSPADIVSLRETYGLTQRGLSALLGMGEITIHRYENGSLPDEANNQLLRMLQTPWNMQRLLRERGDQLPRSQREKVMARVAQLVQEETPDKIVELAAGELVNKQPSEYTGFRRFSPEILMEMMVFCAEQTGSVFKTKINKLLWYSDFLHYRYFGASISGGQYIHLPHGPVVDQYEIFLNYLLQTQALSLEEVFFENGSGERLLAQRHYQESLLSPSAVKVIAVVCEHFKSVTSRQISEIAHAEEGYLQTKTGQPISYRYADRIKVDLISKLEIASE